VVGSAVDEQIELVDVTQVIVIATHGFQLLGLLVQPADIVRVFDDARDVHLIDRPTEARPVTLHPADDAIDRAAAVAQVDLGLQASATGQYLHRVVVCHRAGEQGRFYGVKQQLPALDAIHAGAIVGKMLQSRREEPGVWVKVAGQFYPAPLCLVPGVQKDTPIGQRPFPIRQIREVQGQCHRRRELHIRLQ